MGRVQDDEEVLGTAVAMGAQPCEQTCSLPLSYKSGLNRAVSIMWAWPRGTKTKDRYQTSARESRLCPTLQRATRPPPPCHHPAGCSHAVQAPHVLGAAPAKRQELIVIILTMPPAHGKGGAQPHPEQTAGASALTLDSVPGWMLASSSQSPTDTPLQPRPLTGDLPPSSAPLTAPQGCAGHLPRRGAPQGKPRALLSSASPQVLAEGPALNDSATEKACPSPPPPCPPAEQEGSGLGQLVSLALL